jgi:dipeptidase
MCDTFVALGNSTRDGSVLFAKNSDRDPNEAHALVMVPAATHQPGEMVKCTYIEIPQVASTYQVLLSKPFWIWGAEMGTNEFGVTIGNEALFTREPYQKEPGLIGMDFLRLALERGKSAAEAMQVIIDLLEQYGQSGNCGYAHPFYYHNSYIICDRGEAWVLETVGKEWVAEKVQAIRSISNGITIQKKWDRVSQNLVQHAIDKGWCKNAADFDFQACYSDPLYTRFAEAHYRQNCTTEQLREKQGDLTVADMMCILRTHREPFHPGHGVTGADVCMHAGWGPIRTSQSAGSMVSVLPARGDAVHWLTGTAAPCTSIFKPVWMDSGLPESVKVPGGEYDASVLFWRHEVLHREILKDYAARIRPVVRDRDTLEKDFLEGADNHSLSLAQKQEITRACFARSAAQEDVWLAEVQKIPATHPNGILYTLAWKKLNQMAHLPGSGTQNK